MSEPTPKDLAAAANLARAIEDPATYWEERCEKAENAYRDAWKWWQTASTEVERLRGEVADMVPRDWHGLMAILDHAYPESIFPTTEAAAARDPGWRIIALTRRLDQARGELARQAEQITAVRALTGGPFADGYQPYAVELEDGVHLAVLLDDLRAALDGGGL